MIDFDSINPVINQNVVEVARIDDHPRAAHNFKYTPINLKSERLNQPDWVGYSKRPKKIENI